MSEFSRRIQRIWSVWCRCPGPHQREHRDSESSQNLRPTARTLAPALRSAPMNQRIMIYGATGYTGKLVAAEAVRRGLDVVLAGRSPEKLKSVAEPLGCESQAITLTDPMRLRAALENFAAVLHIAGPFSQTARPMVDACLETHTHYLDVTGEIDVFEAIARRNAEAEAAGVLLLPGVGFDVVPSDCLAAHTAARVEEPTTLRLALAGMDGGVSRGTARSAVESLGDGLRIRQDGIIRSRPPGSLERHFDFGAGPTRGLAMPWGDIATAFHSTKIPNIEVYFILSGSMPTLIKASRFVTRLLRRSAVQRFLMSRIDAMPEGPDEAARNETRALLLAEVEGPGGQCARTLLETPSGYALTPHAAVESAVRAAAGEAPSGYHTPSTAFGADFVLDLPDCRRTDLE
jgi:short subunit dehydrogenase-like uncharacterized protein